jgi:type III restriction enzyme
LEPDFVLFLVGKTKTDTMHYQVFIEPKGRMLLLADAWKEEFLASIKDQGQVEQLIENRQYVVWGLPFFNFGERMPEFEAGLNELLS